MSANHIELFEKFMAEFGLTGPDAVVDDGVIHKFSTNGHTHDRAGWYILHGDGIPAGRFGCWRGTVPTTSWCMKSQNQMTKEELSAHRRQVKAQRKAVEAETLARQAIAARRVKEILNGTDLAKSDHPYLARKGVQAHEGLRFGSIALYVPMTDPTTGNVCSLQKIDPDGTKRFHPGGKTKGCYFQIGTVTTGSPPVLVIGEGYATCATIFESTGLPVFVAFDCGNLLAVAKALRAKYPEAVIIFAADDDWKTAGNPGKTKSKEAALAIGGAVVLPLFGADRGLKDTDFNDLFKATDHATVASYFSEFTSGLINSGVTEVTGVTDSSFSNEETTVLGVTPTVIHEVTGVTKPTETVIPYIMERPKYVVLDDWHEESGRKYRPGVWYFGMKAGKKDGEETPIEIWICSPLHVDAVTTDQHQNNFGRLIRFRTTLGRWRTWAMPMDMLRGDCADLRGELLSMGVEIDPHGRSALAGYLQRSPPKRRIQCVMQTGWAAGTDFKAFVLPDAVIGPKADSVAFQSGEGVCEEYAPAGTLDGWQSKVAAMAVGNPLLMIGICAAFAGPLLARCGAESGGMHFIGDSSTGKTTIVEAACSVWGGAGFKRSWRTTGNGLEGVASLFNDSLLALDEISECDPRQVGEVVYMLGNGRGKQRASRTGAARAVSRWTSSVLSTGERSIETTMIEGGHAVKAGQSVRLLDVPAQRQYGAWDNLHDHQSGAEFSNALKRAAVAHYGHAGRAFLEKLTRDHDDFGKALEFIKATPELQTPGEEGQAKRAAARFAVLALAGELATSYGVTGWPVGEAIKAAGVGLAAWQSLRGGKGKGNSESGQIVDKLTSFIERHGDSRFSDADSDDDRIPVRDRAGWWRNVGGDAGPAYLFTGEGLREALKGFDFNRALDALQLAGMISAPNADGKRAKAQRIRGRLVRVYAIHMEKTEGETP